MRIFRSSDLYKEHYKGMLRKVRRAMVVSLLSAVCDAMVLPGDRRQ